MIPGHEEFLDYVMQPKGYARHLTELRRKRTDSTEELLGDLSDLNAEAIRNAIYMEQAAEFLDVVAGSEMPMNAIHGDIREMADVASEQADWLDDLGVALKHQHDRVAGEFRD